MQPVKTIKGSKRPLRKLGGMNIPETSDRPGSCVYSAINGGSKQCDTSSEHMGFRNDEKKKRLKKKGGRGCETKKKTKVAGLSIEERAA